ncbi:MAG TPA: hypothetical protein VFF67_03670 [Thermoplasmata archaeon]|nr:hypothetical protein [Thermoplasmata archaeon]
MTTDRSRRTLVAAAFVAFLAASSVLVVVGAQRSPTFATLPHPVLLTAPRAAALPAAPAPASPAPSYGCPTPTNQVVWGDPHFFNDVQMKFAFPGDRALTGANFQTVPCVNSLPTYGNGFWMNLTTNVPITTAYVTIWGWTWPSSVDPTPPLSGYSPVNPRQIYMQVLGPSRTEAVFYFNVYRFFWPGSTVYFNVTAQSANATPSTIFSADTTNGKWLPVHYEGGYTDNATWGFYVQAPFASARSFASDINITTTPNVFSSSDCCQPNYLQQLQITISAVGANGAPGLPIPQALLYVSAVGTNYTFQDRTVAFGPANHTVMRLSHPLGPYPDTRISFNVTAWLPWEGGAIDRIYSPVYSFNWTKQGGWWYPNSGLETNLQLSTSPGILPPNLTVLPTGTAVQVSVHEPIENVTINSAIVNFRYVDRAGSIEGFLPMQRFTNNTSVATIPGLPLGGQVTFSVVAKDAFNDPTPSGNFTYSETGQAVEPALPPGDGLLFFEGIDVARGGGLIADLNYTIANSTWSESGFGTPLGFGAPTPVGGPGYLPVSFGTYTVTVRAFGESQVASFALQNATPLTIVFFLASGPIVPTANVPVNPMTISAVGGLAAGAITVVPVSRWFKERRAKAEAEQKRISL